MQEDKNIAPTQAELSITWLELLGRYQNLYRETILEKMFYVKPF